MEIINQLQAGLEPLSLMLGFIIGFFFPLAMLFLGIWLEVSDIEVQE